MQGLRNLQQTPLVWFPSIRHAHKNWETSGSYYTGHTDNLEQRLAQHQQRYFPFCYTATRLPVELVFTQMFPTRVEALASEQQIKGWSRKKKEAMMRGDWNEVSRLAKSKQTLRQAQGERSPDATGGVQNSTVCAEPVEAHTHQDDN